MYIYTQPGVEIHPDELRTSVALNSDMAIEADNVWINNYVLFCNMRRDEGEVNIVDAPDYFCMPFDVKRVTAEVNQLKIAGRLEPRQTQPDRRAPEEQRWGASWQNSRGYDNSRGYGRGNNKPRGRGNQHEQGWYSGRDQNFSGREPKQGSFEREYRNGSATPQAQNSTPEYEYRNVPYDYTR